MKETIDPANYALPAALDATLSGLWTDASFATDGSDLAMLNACIHAAKPKVIVELGTATGLSTGSLAVMQAHAGVNGKVCSFDLRDRLWFDESRSVGDAVPTIAGDLADRVELNTGVTSLAVAEQFNAAEVGMAFIDASHQHPWPVLDTLMVLPVMAPRAPIVHHDLQLFRNEGNPVGVGPKVLYDQLRPAQRCVASELKLGAADVKTPSRSVADNVFVMWRRENLNKQARELSEALLLPWSLSEPMDPDLAQAITERLKAAFHPEVARNFQIGLARFEGSRARAVEQASPPAKAGLWARIARRFRSGAA